MKLLEDRIRRDGKIRPGNVLKVDGFINHRIDVPFVSELGREFYRRFENDGVTKILTIEASGIGIACLTAQHFGVPVVFAKKSRTSNLSSDVYTARVDSFTHGTTCDIVVSKEYLDPSDRVLIIDDFLALGNALMGLREITLASGATLVGAGIVIEKSFQPGGKLLREMGMRIESLAKIASMTDDALTFEEE
ncbi:MAG: xanthine phosphoribosyltransferase [Clostridia bacterium]|nr:xanthine phosphoribosyltransferase [Clostridia bacterium]MBP5427728.1 xanthine phosphoribosyltransferase [Clostridia bacterium]